MADIPNDWQNTSSLFVALGDTQRQRILLTFEPNERMNILQIVAMSTLSRTAVSHHLKVLRESGVLNSEKIGKEVYFWVNKTFIMAELTMVLNYINTEI